ncbi:MULTISPECIES: hypothetical protein [Aeromonas]|uniref:hypothetical protein n=1 Tax=Aeromonas TaxID=642 RepID=UPI001058DD08|nr:hypothetical protein [Aeromonas hydrophila]
MSQATPTTKSYDVLIQLEQEDSSKSFSTNELIQRRHYDSIRSEINAHLGKWATPNPCKQDDEPYGNGWTYFIDGSRGAGKSTFLSSVEAALQNDADLKTQMAFIAVIDPSRIEQSEIILLVILQQLSKQVNDALKGLRQTHNEPLREEWRRVFKGVAGGLSLFSKEYHPLNDLDPELFLEWGLERTSDSTSLRTKLHHLFETACRILGVKGIMFGFDDADTGTVHAIKLLECIRKYLDTPRVMVLVTGDMELYSLLVRQHFATTLAGKPDAALDLQRRSRQRDRSDQYLRMIDHMEDQYLLKLFPIHRRIQLKSLWGMNPTDKYNVKHHSWGRKSYPLKDVTKAIVGQGLRVKSHADVDVYTEFLLKQPLRSVLQVLTSCAPHLTISTPKNVISAAWSPDLTRELSRSLQALALTSLYKLSIDTDAIASQELPALTQAIFDLSLEDGDMDTAPYLRPMSAEQDIKACFAALAAEIPNFCTQNPGAALRYLLRGPGSVSLYNLAQSQPCNTLEFKSYMGIGRGEDSLDWARRATAVIALPYSSNYKPRVVLPGIIGLRRNLKGRKGELTAQTVINKAIENSLIQYLPVFSLSLVTVTNATSPRTYGSILTLVGLIEKLLSAYVKSEEEAHTAFERAYPSLTISSPNWSRRGDPNKEEDNDQPGEVPSDVKNKKEALWGTIKIWLESISNLSKNTTPSGIFLGKVWTRLFFSLQNASDELKAHGNFSSVMEIYTLCVINSFLVEEAEHHLINSQHKTIVNSIVDRTNPRTKADWFVDKLKSTKLTRDDFPFTAIVATCPLLLGLLDSELDYITALKPLFPTSMNDDAIKALLCPKELKELMQLISVAGESRVKISAAAAEVVIAPDGKDKASDE